MDARAGDMEARRSAPGLGEGTESERSREGMRSRSSENADGDVRVRAGQTLLVSGMSSKASDWGVCSAGGVTGAGGGEGRCVSGRGAWRGVEASWRGAGARRRRRREYLDREYDCGCDCECDCGWHCVGV